MRNKVITTFKSVLMFTNHVRYALADLVNYLSDWFDFPGDRFVKSRQSRALTTDQIT